MEEMEEDSTEIGRQRSKKMAHGAGLLCSRSTSRSTGGGGRSTDVHVCAQVGAVDGPRSTGPGRPTEVASSSGRRGGPGRSTVAWVGRPVGRPQDFPFRIQIPFLDGIESNLGFHKFRDSVAINRG